MTYKFKSLLYLMCFIAACGVYYQMDAQPEAELLADKMDEPQEQPIENAEEEGPFAHLEFNKE